MLKEIVDVMREHSRVKAEGKRLVVEMIKLAVETGLTQEEALKAHLPTYLDGYLMALGHMPEYRKDALND